MGGEKSQRLLGSEGLDETMSVEAIVAQRAECERLRQLAHETPMNKVFETHKGNKFLGSHLTTWADRGREWMAACERLDAMLVKEI